MRNGGELIVESLARACAPVVLDVHVDPDIRPPAVGTWALPPLPHGEPAFGARRLPEEETR